MGVFGAERGAKCVNLAQGQAIGFEVELARYGQKSLMAKKVLAEINLAVFGARNVEQVKAGNPEHLAGALGVRCGNDGRVDPVIAALVKKVVYGASRGVAHARDGAKCIGARAQMVHTAQEFKAVSF